MSAAWQNERPMRHFGRALLAIALSAASTLAFAQDPASLTPVVRIGSSYRATTDITYLKVGAFESKLDVYQNRTAPTAAPTLVWIHGGNWVGGSKDASLLTLLPFFQMGWNVVNVDYRLLQQAPAPAAAEDCHCALRWVYEHAREFNIDATRVVVSGNSAGGHLSLVAAMAPLSAGFDTLCPGPADLKVAAVINWYGFPNLLDVLSGRSANTAVNNWIGGRADRQDLALRLSPSSYVRSGAPPILTIHGNQDPTSPYELAVEFHGALTKAGVPNELFTVANGKHGGFGDADTVRIYEAIAAFLARAVPPRDSQ